MAQADQERLRLFIAVWLDPAAQASIAPMERWIKRLGSFRLVPAEQRHLTVAFLGDVGLAEAEQLGPAIERACQPNRPFAAEFTGVALLPKPSRTRVIGADLDGGSGLDGLIGRIRESAAQIAPTDALLKELQRPPRPHITVARALPRSGVGRVDATSAPALTGRLNVGSVCVVRSVLTSTGPIYKTIQSVPLGGSA